MEAVSASPVLFVLCGPADVDQSGVIQAIGAAYGGAAVCSPAVVREAWLRTVSRPPTEQELTRAVKHVKSEGTVVDGIRDLLWALLNTKEFILIK